MNLKAILALFKDTFSKWNKDNGPRLGASLAFYTLFSLAPLLLIVIAITGLVFGQKAVEGQIVGQIGGLVGGDSAKAIQTMITNVYKPSTGAIATIIGIATLLLGATAVFVDLQGALNTIWGARSKSWYGMLGIVKVRFLSFAMILCIAFLLLVSLVVSAVLSALSKFLTGLAPSFMHILQIVDFFISFGFIAVLLAMMYKLLPDIKIAWSDVWSGAAVTSLLFTIGKYLIGLYLGRSSVTSPYGAAGSLVIILVWVYYSAQILFFGAEFTQVYTNKYGSLSHAREHAGSVSNS